METLGPVIASAPEAPPSKPDRGADSVIEISALAGGLAHEIRNPLSTLKVNLQLMAEELRDEGLSERDLRRRGLSRIEALQKEVRRLQGILDDFLKLVGSDAVTVQAIDLNELVESMIDFFTPQAAAHGILIRSSAGEPVLPCLADPDRLKQAVMNLMINAQQAMPEGGEMLIRTFRRHDQAVLEIADTGVGIDPSLGDRIFAPYFSTKPLGTGIGLTMTRRIVQEMKGEIAYRSDPGMGSSFTIALPSPLHFTRSQR